ncbi:hypothetical protein RV11_GL000714 [Enterococcus phoeniculicola]|uniref:UvrD-like helicase ATP-binding domain-containing protein n=1 Tax=Enterococcus phoeniculicola ATCC BAA-412 TaxID=1158610 RepID=R3WKZ9_9ENTE|nr:UvrD-helicase domain-containing protein [Enterococcus phoeniculicola]EOL42545.1 hypothetical protein UC3_02898 [Enterococcus phoeniculicola ATCC BAA-412]EOT79176.1 hypothetical protein I589_00683 [Enterococcus phoeniculicola ATCC BAA-412]OJG70999.1 hypothetical protein RV11_GL000714 [Enterococcus phoeniculicola]
MVNTQEEKYLQQVYGELVASKEQLDCLLKRTKDEGITALNEMSGDIRLNFDSVLDNLDTFSMIEMKNREIDQMNIKIQSADSQRKKVERLLKSPYFGKVSVDFLESEPQEDFYIGIHNFANEEGVNRIYDWRSPIAELFYNNMIGPSSYLANEKKIDVEILNRRQFFIEKNHLIRYFDTAIAIQDDVLIAALEQNATQQMTDITSTIQREQNTIIRDIASRNILVNGVAGSGKTSTIMQRIAYLLYSLRKEMTSEDFLILSPNNKFIHYISDVLPALGEKNPRNQTMLQFTQLYLNKEIEDEGQYFERISANEIDEQMEILRSKSFIDFLKKMSQDVWLGEIPIVDLKKKETVIIPKEVIEKLYNRTPKDAPIIERIQATKELLSEYWKNRLLRQASSEETQNQILSLSEEQQKLYFGELISDDSEKSIIAYGYKRLRKTYRKISKMIQQVDWIDKKTLFLTLYKSFGDKTYIHSGQSKYTLDEAVIFLFIQHCFVEKIPLPKTKFLFIDEVQDYTPAQIQLLMELFPKSQFTLVGDENQSIFNSSISFATVIDLFADNQRSIYRYDLLNSYRSSGAITEVFKKLSVQSTKQMEIIPIRPKGEEPKLYLIKDHLSFISTIHKITSDIGGTLTILTKTMKEAESLQKQLKKETEQKLIAVYPISLSKGLEFDHVFLYNVSKDRYKSKRDKKILYTAVSRAMQTLAIGYEKEVSVFLKSM